MAAPMKSQLTTDVIQKLGLKFIDIGANLTDGMFRGIYHASQKHRNDLSDVLKRAKDNGVDKIIITGGSLSDSEDAVKLANMAGNQGILLAATVGCHPTRCQEYAEDPDTYTKQLLEVLLTSKGSGSAVAVGECGLDYDRLHFCGKEIQKKYFEEQFSLAEESKLPMFLHCRNSSADFIDILKRNRDRFSTGVVHSFTGAQSDIESFIELDLFIGINGCSLKTQENIETMCKIPSERLMIETDAPWCEIKSTHAGFKHVTHGIKSYKKEKWVEGYGVKGRNEPGTIVQVLEVMAASRNEDICELANIIYDNTNKIFFQNDSH